MGAVILAGLFFTGLQSLALQTDQMLLDGVLRGRLETLIGTDFGSLTSDNETVTAGGESYTVTWTVVGADLDGDSVPEPDARRVTVSVTGIERSLTTLIVDHQGQVGKL